MGLEQVQWCASFCHVLAQASKIQLLEQKLIDNSLRTSTTNTTTHMATMIAGVAANPIGEFASVVLCLI
jgi:hypothetical protein